MLDICGTWERWIWSKVYHARERVWVRGGRRAPGVGVGLVTTNMPACHTYDTRCHKLEATSRTCAKSLIVLWKFIIAFF
jgi:hypothetical protein